MTYWAMFRCLNWSLDAAVWRAMIEVTKEMGIPGIERIPDGSGEAREATDLYEASIKKTDTAKCL